MRSPQVYLKPQVAAEPLFNQWYAWSYLIAPASAAMYMQNSHLKVMQSFITAPQVHMAALKNPAMVGGPFMHHDQTRVDEVRRLLEHTKKTYPQLLRLAEAIKDLELFLAKHATGYSLAELYPQVPEPLRGYVELVYDLHNHPSVRFIEGLLYKSPYYDPRAQSLELFLAEQDDRSFAFSTPRLNDNRRVRLHVPFCSAHLDTLFQMRHTPQPLAEMQEALGLSANGVATERAVFSSLFTEQPPPAPSPFEAAGVRVRYFGHACVLVESRSVNILLDPVLAYQTEAADSVGNANKSVARYSFFDLPETLEYVLITHNHQDHCMFETLLPLRHKIRTLVVPKSSATHLADPSLKRILQQLGFRQVYEIDELEAIPVDGGTITALPFLGEHGDLNIQTKASFLIQLHGHSLLFVADSNNLEPRLHEHIRALKGEVEVLFIGMECEGGPLSWLYGPLLTAPLARKMDQSRRFDGSDCEKALALANSLGVKQVYVYAMGQEPWLRYLTSIVYTDTSRPIIESDKFISLCHGKGIGAERLFGCKEFLLR